MKTRVNGYQVSNKHRQQKIFPVSAPLSTAYRLPDPPPILGIYAPASPEELSLLPIRNARGRSPPASIPEAPATPSGPARPRPCVRQAAPSTAQLRALSLRLCHRPRCPPQGLGIQKVASLPEDAVISFTNIPL